MYFSNHIIRSENVKDDWKKESTHNHMFHKVKLDSDGKSHRRGAIFPKMCSLRHYKEVLT